MEKELAKRQMEELFAIFNAIEGSIYVADMHTYEILAVNKYCETHYGPGLVGKICYEELQENLTAPCSFCTNPRLIGTDGTPNPPVVWEFENAKSGFWYHCIDKAIHWPDGRLVRMEMAFDITAQKRTGGALQASIQQLGERVKELNCLFSISSLVEKRQLALADILQGIVELIPPAWQYPDIAGARIRMQEQTFQTSNYRNTPWKLIADINVHENKVGHLEVCYLEQRPESEEEPFLKEERILLDAIAERAGKIIERTQAERSLQESEKRFRDLVENSLVGIFIIQDDQVVYKNPELDSLLGPVPKEFNLVAYTNIHPTDTEKVKQGFHNLSSGKSRKLDMEFRFYPEGKMDSRSDMKWVHCRASLIDYRKKEAILVCMMDVTRAKELEHLLIVQDKMASLGRVAAGMAHEIRNPLSGINIYLNTLVKLYNKGEGLDKVIGILNQLQSASGKIESVIRRVMDFSMPSAPRLDLTDINQPIEEAIKLTAVTLRKSGIKIDTALAQDLPTSLMDPHMIEEVIVNLITNAADAMKNLTTGKRVRITSSVQNKQILVTVYDSGPGVPLKLRDKIFDPFYTTKPDSTGIGLSLCGRIIADHGGSISVHTSQWGGGEFVMRLPVNSGEKQR
jgi:PAS domain S-box-containing protein